MPSFREQWVPETESGWGSWVDIDPATFTGSFATNTVRGFTVVFAGGGVSRYIATITESGCFIPTPTPPTPGLPTDADPPFPPVYPYFFATGDLYGRNNLSLNLKMVRGDTYTFSASIILNGDPVDLTGGTVRMTAKWSASDADNAALFQLSSPASGIVITSAVDGDITVTVASALTTSLPAKKVELPYDIQFVDAGGSVFTVLYGTLTIVPDITVTA